MPRWFGKGWKCCWMPLYYDYDWFEIPPFRQPPYTRLDKLTELKDYREFLKEELDYVEKRISELEKEVEKK